jgi:hypothetical protein
MLHFENPVLWLAAALSLGGLVVLLRSCLGAEARARRRRDRSHGPIVSRKRGPQIKLAVEVDNPKANRKS